jgi:hypothetical protein
MVGTSTNMSAWVVGRHRRKGIVSANFDFFLLAILLADEIFTGGSWCLSPPHDVLQQFIGGMSRRLSLTPA